MAGRLTGQLPDPYEQDIPLTDASRDHNIDSRPPSGFPCG